MRNILGLVATMLFTWMLAGDVLAEPVKVDVQALAKVGAATMEKMKHTPASWTSVTTLEAGTSCHVFMLRSGNSFRAIFMTVLPDGKMVEFFRILSREGVWYVTDRAGNSGKYRPYEAPAEASMFYLFLLRSEPAFVDGPTFDASQLESVEGGIATFRVNLPDSQMQRAKSLIAQAEDFTRQSPKQLTPLLAKRLELLKDMIAHGIPNRVDLTNGLIIEYGGNGFRTRFSDFQLLEKVDETEFAVPAKNWQDFTDDPTAGNLDDLAMIQHQPGATVKHSGDPDGRLIDVRTGRFRRLPFPGGSVVAGCFLKDRRSVIVAGLSASNGVVRPYKIDLKTGRCDPFGGPDLEQGFTLAFDLSPDGKTVAALSLKPTRSPPQFRVYLIDVETGKDRALGDPMSITFMSWMRDGKRLLLMTRENEAGNTDTLATMDMAGKVTPLRAIRRGASPILLADRETILFVDVDTRLWHTSSLLGENVKIFADGLKDYDSPAVAPDGKRLLMMHKIDGSLPKPVVFDLGDTWSRALTRIDGLWARPVWR